jgi:IS1 family transposase
MKTSIQKQLKFLEEENDIRALIDKAETSLVETMNDSLRGHIVRFIRRTKNLLVKI